MGHDWFQPTLPLRGATAVSAYAVGHGLFQPTLPLRGATYLKLSVFNSQICFNPRSPCGERPRAFSRSSPVIRFNPRSPCGERPRRRWPSSKTARFNPRSPCGERLLHLVNVALRAYHMHDVFHPNASSDELRPSETNQKAVRTSQGIPDSPQFAPPIIPTAYS